MHYSKTITHHHVFLKITVGDADGDHVRCRWAESYPVNECGDVCGSFPVTLKGRQVGCSCYSNLQLKIT